MSPSDDSLVMTTLWGAEWAEIIWQLFKAESFKQDSWVTTLKVIGYLGPERISCDDKKTGHRQNTM